MTRFIARFLRPWRWRPRCIRYSLRSLLVAMLLVSIACAWLAVQIREYQFERRFIEEMSRNCQSIFCPTTATVDVLFGPAPG